MLWHLNDDDDEMLKIVNVLIANEYASTHAH